MTEISVWKIFDCLVDGLAVMEYGNELALRSPFDSFSPVVRPDWDPLVHFDLKPPNSMLKGTLLKYLIRKLTHTCVSSPWRRQVCA